MEKDYTWKPAWTPLQIEADIHLHDACEKAHLFDVADPSSTEFEVLNWLHATVRVMKPEVVLETGAWEGMGTIALAHACKLNGFGKVHSLEHNPETCAQVRQRLADEGLSEWAEVHECDSMKFLEETDLIFDIGFFDTLIEIKADEGMICMRRGIIKKIAVFHDTAATRTTVYTTKEEQDTFRNKIFDMAKNPLCTGYFEWTLSRGFIALFLRG